MPSGTPERDWEVFRELREVALERLCERALREADAVIRDSSTSPHERFLQLYALIDERDDDVARAFDGPRRSAMLGHLLIIHSLGLLEPGELARFSAETRAVIEPGTAGARRDDAG